MGVVGGQDLVLTRRMALTQTEFLRSLPAAVAGMDCRIEGTRILLQDPPRRLEIHLEPREDRKLGSLLLPQTDVRLKFGGFSNDELQHFLKRFDLAFQRGGG